MATITLVVPAAGCGARAALNGNKILAPLCGKPLLWHTLRTLTNERNLPRTVRGEELLVPSKPEEWPLIRRVIEDINAERYRLLKEFNERTQRSHSIMWWTIVEGKQRVEDVLKWRKCPGFVVRLVEGGATRQDSVHAAVNVARGDYVLVHDAARPLLSPEVMRRTIEAAIENGAAIAALPVADTVKRVSGNNIEATLPREEIYLAQTPQVFRREILAEALKSAQEENFQGTDCSSLVERLRATKRVLASGDGAPQVAVVLGDAQNFKVTYAADLERAAQILNREELT